MQTLADLKQGEEARIIAFTNLDIGAKLLKWVVFLVKLFA